FSRASPSDPSVFVNSDDSDSDSNTLLSTPLSASPADLLYPQQEFDPEMSARSHSAAPKAKHQHTKSKSKAIITSDDDMELDNAVAEVLLKGVLKTPKYVEIDELDDEEAMIVGPAPKMGMPYVEIPLAPKASNKAAGGLQEDTNADTTSLVWLPGCGGCVQQQLICHQGYNAHHEPLAVCTHCHHTKNKCGSKGFVAPTKSRRPATN
ncbi:hypothetical protein BDR05DRAFT_953605, partial [Suillus weaverae]